MSTWRILVVDDDADIHQITTMAFRRKQWNNRAFELTSAYSAEEARKILAEKGSDHFHVAIVDVVMESDDAGLRLCQDIRSEGNRTLRLVLRTGQPGVAPEETVFNNYDIDTYLAKSEATAERMMLAVRSSLRMWKHLSTLQALWSQMSGMAHVLGDGSTPDKLFDVVGRSLEFLEDKFNISLVFVSDGESKRVQEDDNLPSDLCVAAVERAYAADSARNTLLDATGFDLAQGAFVFLPHALPRRADLPEAEERKGRLWQALGKLFSRARKPDEKAGIVVFLKQEPTELETAELQQDLTLFLESWLLGSQIFRFREAIIKAEVESRYASSVAGVG